MQQGLTVELVPRSAWWSNVRSNVSKSDWEKCKTYARAKTDQGGLPACLICGDNGINQGYRYPVEAHEIWDYEDEHKVRRGSRYYDPTAPREERIVLDTGLQTLVDIWPLCPLCHQVKHLGHLRAENDPQKWARAIEHLMRVNNWPDWKTEKYVRLMFDVWELRSQLRWALDIGVLNSRVGLNLPQTFFAPAVRA